MFIDHIAVLTGDLRRQSDALPDFCQKQAIENFPAEGTREQYVEIAQRSPKLLLLQAIAEGPYARTLQKRGPGLHHLGARTQSIKALVPSLTQSGLLLHPISIQTLAQGVAWLCRPGMPFLIELCEGKPETDFDILALGLPKGTKVPDIVAGLFSNLRIQVSETDTLEFMAGDRRVQLPLV